MVIRHIATSIELATSKTVFYGNSLPCGALLLAKKEVRNKKNN